MVAHTFKPSTQEASRPLSLRTASSTEQDYIARPHLKNKKKIRYYFLHPRILLLVFQSDVLGKQETRSVSSSLAVVEQPLGTSRNAAAQTRWVF